MANQSEEIQKVVHHMDDIITLDVLVDGQKIPCYRVRSEPTFFEIHVPVNNVVQIPNGGSTLATADGYWVFLKPLPAGKHTIYFNASCSAGTRNVKANYEVNVGGWNADLGGLI